MPFFKKLFSKKEKPTNPYLEFWDWFTTKESVFAKTIKNQENIKESFFDAISPKLGEIKEGIFFLVGMDDDTIELILTPDGNIKNVVFIEELVDAAPQLEGWKFIALKPSHKLEGFVLKMGDYEFSKDNLHFYPVTYEDYPDEIEIVVVHDDCNEENRGQIGNGIFIFLDNYLGELNFITAIDRTDIKGKKETEKTLIPIEKLKDFIHWRQKEFIEKYQGLRHHTEKDNHSILTAELEGGDKLIAVLNTDLLKWEQKASHPWVMIFEIEFEGENNGMPNKETSALLETIEEDLMDNLKDFNGYLNIGRETRRNNRAIFFACKDFREPSKVAYFTKKKYEPIVKIDFELYKDKYWQTFNRYGIS